MSHVSITVELSNGNGMTYRPVNGVVSKDEIADARSKLHRGYELLDRWLTSQLPPPRQPVETRGLQGALVREMMYREAEAIVALSNDKDGGTYGVDDHDPRCASQTGWGDYCTCASIREFE